MKPTKTAAIIYCTIFCIISIFVSLITISTIYHFYHHKLCTYKTRHLSQSNNHNNIAPKYEINPKIKYSTIIGIVCNTIQVYSSFIMMIITAINPSKHNDWHILAPIGILFYAIGRWTMSYSFIIRLDITFKSSMYQYSSWILKLLYLFLGILGLCKLIVFIAHLPLNWTGIPLSIIYEIRYHGAETWAILESIFSVLLLFLFIKKLFGLFSMTIKQSDLEKKEKFGGTLSQFPDLYDTRTSPTNHHHRNGSNHMTLNNNKDHDYNEETETGTTREGTGDIELQISSPCSVVLSASPHDIDTHITNKEEKNNNNNEENTMMNTSNSNNNVQSADSQFNFDVDHDIDRDIDDIALNINNMDTLNNNMGNPIQVRQFSMESIVSNMEKAEMTVDKNTLSAMTKYTLLVISIIISSSLFITSSIIFMDQSYFIFIFIGIDSFINALSMYLFNRFTAKIYATICGFAHRKCQKCCICCISISYMLR